MASPGRLVGRPGGVTATRRQAALGTFDKLLIVLKYYEAGRWELCVSVFMFGEGGPAPLYNITYTSKECSVNKFNICMEKGITSFFATEY